MSMYITCLDLEGVLVPEIWIAFAEATGIEELKRTYESFNHITFEEQLDDSAFEHINISLRKEIFYDKSIKITK